MMTLREEAEKSIDGGEQFWRLGEVNTFNLTKVNGGVQNNVVPQEVRAVFDIRLGVNADFEGLEKQFQKWCEEVGGDIKVNYLVKEQKVSPTTIDDTNPFWIGIKRTMEEMGLKYQPTILPGITDNRYVRQAGIPALGFSPLANTPALLHDNNEYLKAETYLKGIEIYTNILAAIANA